MLRPVVAAAVLGVVIVGCGTLLDAGGDDQPEGQAPDAAREGTTAANGDGGSPMDATDGPADTAAPTDGSDAAEAGPPPKLLFVSQGLTDGAMKFGDSNAAGGRGNADAVCQAEALGAGRNGTFVAWLSVASQGAIERLPAGVSWRLPNGPVVFDSKADIPAGPIVVINRFASGTTAATADVKGVFTGTSQSGAYVPGETCGDWTETIGGAFIAKAGAADSTTLWTSKDDVACNTLQRVYCFQQ